LALSPEAGFRPPHLVALPRAFAPVGRSPLPPAAVTVRGAVSPADSPAGWDELVVRAQRGDEAAFGELFRKHRSVVAAIAYRMLGPSADLEDVVQEVFLQVHRSLPDFRGQSKFSTWLHRVAVNVVLMTRRRARSRPTYASEEAARHEPADVPSPDQDVARARRVEAFRRLLDKLSDKKRTVFVLHEIEGIAPDEIATIVACPVLTVRTRLFYARKELAEMMRAEPSLAAFAELGERRKQVERGGPSPGRKP
jgi:RNA polymerase sigma factor (sigma-70 family)